MRPNTNRLLMLMISAMLAGCASQTERSASGSGGDEVQPEAEEVQFVDRPLEATPPPAPEPVPEPAPAPEPVPEPVAEPEPLPDFPVTTYELPEEEEVGDLGTQPDDSGTVSYPEQDLASSESTVGAPTTYTEEEEEEVGDLGTQPDNSGTVSYPEQNLYIGESTVGAPTVYPDQVAVSVTFEAEPLFNFDKSFVRGDQRRVLDEFVASLAGAEYESIDAVGYADRIGPEAYNQKLSERRAEAVKAYLMAKGIPGNKIRTEGRGETETLTGEACSGMKGTALIGCLQPDRRVDVTVSAIKYTN